MKKRLKQSLLAACVCVAMSTTAIAQDSDVAGNLINEPSFENTVNAGVFGDYTFMVDIDPSTGEWNEMTGWAGTFGSIDITGVPGDDLIPFTTPYGSRAVRISIDSPNRQIWWPPIAFARPNFRTEPAWWDPEQLASIDRAAVSPGDEVYASARIFTDAPLIGGQFGMIKVAFFDANGLDISPSTIRQGEFDALIESLQCSEFPGAISTLKVDGTSPVNEWLKAQVQATAATVDNDGTTTDALFPTCKDWTNDQAYNPVVIANAPPGAVAMNVFLFNIDPGLTGNPIYFDDVYLGILDPDDDIDGIENRVDTDPINFSRDFSDGTTTGSILSDDNRILSIDEAIESNGVFVESAPASQGAFARISVCDSLASIRVMPNSAFDVTCGSVILDVADDSEAIQLEVTIGGENSYVTIPAGNDVTFDDEDESVLVEPESETAEPVTLRVGSEDAEPAVIAPGVALSFDYRLDVKPGSDENCFNIDGNGVIPVAILGGASENVADIDIESIFFNGLAVREKGNGEPSCGAEDVNGDLVSDLVCHFEDDPTNWSVGNDDGQLTAKLFDGKDIYLNDSICVKP